MARKTKDTPHLRLRIEPRLLERLEKSREKEGRTLTGEIVHRIEQSFQKDDSLDQARQAGLEIMERAYRSNSELALRHTRRTAAVLLKLVESDLPIDDIKATLGEILSDAEQDHLEAEKALLSQVEIWRSPR